MIKKSKPTSTNKQIIPTAYEQFIAQLKIRIQSARLSAAKSVNYELIFLYWDIGQSIVEKQEKLGWGESVVTMLSRDLLAAFPYSQGFSVQNLWRMRQFYLVHTESEFLSQVVRELQGGAKIKSTKLAQHVRDVVVQIPWGHHVNLLAKIKNPAARLYYLRSTAQLGWSRNVLLNQIKAQAYERSLAQGKAHNFKAVLPMHLAEQAEEALKSSYNLEFLGIGKAIKERELENKLIERVQQFILELGYGFCFIGRQHRLTLGRKEYFIDLLFYHRFLKALVAVELKIGSFEPEYAGKMDFYLNLLNEKEKAPDDKPSIGIILCAEKDNLEVEFSLKTKANPIGVAEYHLFSTLPKELKGKLPNKQVLLSALKQELPIKIRKKPKA